MSLPQAVTSALSERDLAQVDAAVAAIRDALGDAALAAWLHGSAVGTGLKPDSDLDILVVTTRPTTPAERASLIGQLLPLSGSRAAVQPARSLEVTVVVASDIRPWRYPPRLDLVYGDWWRSELEHGLEPWTPSDPDLAVLLAAARQGGVPLFGPRPIELIDPIPPEDIRDAIVQSLPSVRGDLDDDTRNVLLTLARMWLTVMTGTIASKDAAADWAIERLPPQRREPLIRARDLYLDGGYGIWAEQWPAVEACAAELEQSIRAAADELPARPES